LNKKNIPVLDHSLLFKLIRVVNLTARPFNEGIGKQFQISLSEWRVMVVLAAHPQISATSVADLTGMDKMSVSRALASLEKHLHVQRAADANDQRVQLSRLTETGLTVYAVVAKTALKREAELMKDISAKERALMDEMLDRLLSRLGS
jgi:DNA-binding MarR family transcriptional regulator